MPLTLVLMSAETGSEDGVVKQLCKISNVKESYSVYGVYDIFAKVEAEIMDNLKEVTRAL